MSKGRAIPEREERVLAAAIELAKEVGFQWITRDEVAVAAGVSMGSVNNSFGTISDLKRAVLSAAVEREIVEIVAQGLADRHPIAMAASDALKRRAAQHLVVA